MGPIARIVCVGMVAAACNGNVREKGDTTPPVAPLAPAPVATPAPPPPQLRVVRCGQAPVMPKRVFAMISGSADASSGVHGDIEGGLVGDEPGEMDGGFGYGRSGFMPPGGETGWAPIGHGSGTGSGYGIGSGQGGMHGRVAYVPRTTIGKPNVTGNLDPAIIRRYIKRNVTRIAYCYEKQLLAKPSLRGSLSTEFRIGSDGLVVSARAKGVDEAVAGCVANALKAIEFPKPRGGGEVAVKYPLTLDPGGHPSGGQPASGADRWVEAAAQIAAAPPEPAEPPALPAWTPFANVYAGVASPDDATVAAVQAAVTVQLPAMAECFPSAAGPTGSLRILLKVDPLGGIVAVYTGGLGDPDSEACVEKAVAAATIAARGTDADIVCDLARGDEAPWRMSRDGYEVVDVDRDRVHFHDQVFASLPVDHPSIRDQSTVLIIADEAAPAGQVERAVTWMGNGHPIVLAVQRGTSGLEYASAFTLAIGGVTFHTNGLRAALRVRAGQMTACLGGKDLGTTAAITDAAAVDKLVAAVKASCTPPSCGTVVEVIPDAAQPLAQALGAVAAIRRAGFEPLLAEHASAINCHDP